MPDIKIEKLDLPSHIKSRSLFQNIQDEPFAMLLDSAESTHPNSNFDIIVANPVATIRQFSDGSINEESVIKASSHNKQRPKGNPFESAQSLLTLLEKHQVPDTHLPFLAGLLGYASYDSGRHLERLPELANNPYNSPNFVVGLYSWSIIKDYQSGTFYLCYAEAFGKPDLTGILVDEPQSEKFNLTAPWQSNLTRQEYFSGIEKIHQYLLAGDCYQVNFAQRFSSQYSGSEWQAYLALIEANHAPFSAYINVPECVIISCSPERFVSVKNRQVETKPIKGTLPRSTDPAQDQQNAVTLQNSSKDRAENLMIVDLLRNDLSKTCEANTVEVSELFAIESFPAVHHLVSTIRAKIKANHSPLDLLASAFPGGSITGAPKIRAMEIIEELEPHRRHIYCGSIFYLGLRDDFDSSICIRTLLLEQDNIYCWAGGGIVADSKAEAEYQESLDKVHKILPVLANLGEVSE